MDLSGLPQFTIEDIRGAASDPEVTLDGYWEAYHVSMVLAGQWTLRTFAAGDARYFRLAGALGWQPAGGTLPEGAEDLGVREGGWDHEHCELCRAQIGVAPDPVEAFRRSGHAERLARERGTASVESAYERN